MKKKIIIGGVTLLVLMVVAFVARAAIIKKNKDVSQKLPTNITATTVEKTTPSEKPSSTHQSSEPEKVSPETQPSAPENNTSTKSESVSQTSNEPPLKIKHIGINLENYNPSTGKAGDLLFTKDKLQFDALFTQYGFVIPGNQSASGSDKSNPQPTFLLPLGSKVYSLVDGVVLDIPKLYSDDYSVMVGTGNSNNPYRYETEHVTNVLVKVGDKVTAGQVIAEVSPHDSQNNSGLGLVEIGILKGGNPPQHICPFNYLDASVKDDITNKLQNLYQSWNEYKGKQIYDTAKESPIGCLTLNPIDG